MIKKDNVLNFLIFFLILSFSCVESKSKREFNYADSLGRVEFVDKDIYEKSVNNLPICCVDVFIYNPIDKSYFLVLRKNAPAKGVWWYPGGRLFKGEKFFDCAIRKCREEANLDIIPITQLNKTFSTNFPDSEWGSSTFTVNLVVFAKLKSFEKAVLNKDHVDFKWVNIETPPKDPYCYQIYKDVLKILKKPLR